jgi:hypothetical protein
VAHGRLGGLLIMLAIELPSDASRRDTTVGKLAYLTQLPLGAKFGRRAWVHRALRLKIGTSRREKHLASHIVRTCHGMTTWPCPPKTLIMWYLATLDDVPSAAGAAGIAMVALLPANYHVSRALKLAPYEVLTLARLWRADDLGPRITPDLTPEILRRLVRGERGRGPLHGIRDEWCARKCRAGGLRAAPRLLVTYADPAMGHDGRTYTAAGATDCGVASSGKLTFAWALDDETRLGLRDKFGHPKAGGERDEPGGAVLH